MSLKDVPIESLLHQEEGTTLDFKQKQYPFHTTSLTQTTEELRSKLVKDLLAFANTQRDSSAYILIGVQEVKGGRSNVTGIDQHLLDNELHDFMNKMTQRPVEFSYSPYHFDGVDVGVIEIPVQEGLFYLKTSYGKLHESTVYIRDGSSTRIVTPDEITEISSPKPPLLVVNWVDTASNKVVCSPHSTHPLVLYPPLQPDEIESKPQPTRSAWDFLQPQYNHNYPQDLIIYTFYKNAFIPIGLQIYNQGETTGKRIRFEGQFSIRDKFNVMDSLPNLPEEYHDALRSIPPSPLLYSANELTMELSEDDESWKIVVEFGDIRPSEQLLTHDNLWFCSGDTGNFTMEGKIIGENIPEPIHCSLSLEFKPQHRPMTLEDIEHAKIQGRQNG